MQVTKFAVWGGTHKVKLCHAQGHVAGIHAHSVMTLCAQLYSDSGIVVDLMFRVLSLHREARVVCKWE